MQLSGAGVCEILQAERTASAMALRQECTWGGGEMRTRPVRLEHGEQEGLGWGRR